MNYCYYYKKNSVTKESSKRSLKCHKNFAMGLTFHKSWNPYYNLGQNKMEQQTPISPKSRMKPREGQKRAIFPSLIWGGGGV